MSKPPTPAEVDHLKMIQANIDRMNRCSFECKKWSVGLVAAVMAAAAGTKPWLAFFGVVPTIIFLFLDAYYLWMERGFRNLYNKVRLGEDTELFVMNPTKHLYPETCPKDDYWAVFASKTVIWVHLVALAGSLIVGWLGTASVGACG